MKSNSQTLWFFSTAAVFAHTRNLYSQSSLMQTESLKEGYRIFDGFLPAALIIVLHGDSLGQSAA